MPGVIVDIGTGDGSFVYELAKKYPDPNKDNLTSHAEMLLSGLNMQVPNRIPENGFYYHYKHDQSGSVNNYAYEVVGVGFHTEDDCRPEDVHMVVYRPLYESSVYKAGKFFDLRPLEMWMENIEKDDKTFPRFQKITDLNVISELERIRNDMYPTP